MKKPFIIAICGLKNSGKTTLICNLLPLLKARGLSVAAIKHDGHDFAPDTPGTDSYKLRSAGAEAVAVYSATKLMLVYQQKTDLNQLINQFSGYDLVLLEGGKSSDYPKIAIRRACITEKLNIDPNTVLAYVGDVPQNQVAPTFALTDYAGLTALIYQTVLNA